MCVDLTNGTFALQTLEEREASDGIKANIHHHEKEDTTKENTHPRPISALCLTVLQPRDYFALLKYVTGTYLSVKET